MPQEDPSAQRLKTRFSCIAGVLGPRPIIVLCKTPLVESDEFMVQIHKDTVSWFGGVLLDNATKRTALFNSPWGGRTTLPCAVQARRDAACAPDGCPATAIRQTGRFSERIVNATRSGLQGDGCHEARAIPLPLSDWYAPVPLTMRWTDSPTNSHSH